MKTNAYTITKSTTTKTATKYENENYKMKTAFTQNSLVLGAKLIYKLNIWVRVGLAAMFAGENSFRAEPTTDQIS